MVMLQYSRLSGVPTQLVVACWSLLGFGVGRFSRFCFRFGVVSGLLSCFGIFSTRVEVVSLFCLFSFDKFFVLSFSCVCKNPFCFFTSNKNYGKAFAILKKTKKDAIIPF
jgi:hypothetical protein